MNPTRRQFLTALSSLPLVGWMFRPLVAAILPRILKHDERLYFRNVTEKPPLSFDLSESLCRVNSNPWRGFATGTVRIDSFGWQIKTISKPWPGELPPPIVYIDGTVLEAPMTIDTSAYVTDVVVGPAFDSEFIDPRTGAVERVTAARLCGVTDFSAIEFGEQQYEPRGAPIIGISAS